MSGAWRRDADGVEKALRAGRPEPSDELVDRLVRSVPVRPRQWSRVSFAAALTVLMVGTFASFGGLGYAASSAEHTVSAVKRIVVTSKHKYTVQIHSAARDQYGDTPVTKVVTKVKTVKTVKTIKVKPHTAGAVASVKSGTLPFTGLSLLGTVLLGLVFVGFGLLLRRREARE